MNDNILSVKNLNVKLDNQCVLNNINFTVKQGEVLIILGPNGAGKTTLLRTLLNLIPYNGEIIWKTDKISYLPPQELVQRKYLPPLTIEDFFKFKHVFKNKILKILKDVKLPTNILRKNFNSLSTGQFQRMIIAWSLVNDPEVLLFDEIVYGIDIGGKETIYSLLHKLWKKRNLTILMVTHDLNIVWEHADNVLCLNKKKICYGKPKQILTIKNLEKTYGTGIKFYKHTHGD